MAADAPIGKSRPRGSNRDYSIRRRGVLIYLPVSLNLDSDAPHSGGSRRAVAQR